jgi:hypothetical protein
VHSYGDDGEDGDGFACAGPEFVGGPLVAGVDYEGAWLEARAAAEALNAALLKHGLTRALIWAQPGWAQDGSGVVYLEGTPLGARKLGAVLDRMAKRRTSACEGA